MTEEESAIAELKASTIALRAAEQAFVAAKRRTEAAFKRFGEVVAPKPEDRP